jgi:hypothetical protein
MQTVLKGKILSQEYVNNNTYSVIAEAAKDVYSQPSSFKVRSDAPLGADGQEVTLSLDIAGYIKNKPYKDKQTQQPKVYQEQIIIFNASIASPQQLKQVS